MKKICFIQLPYEKDVFYDAPFSLMYLAAVAEQADWQAQILDMQNLNDLIPEADIYGVTSTSPQWPDTIKLSERLAKEFPNSLKIVGGNHISAQPDAWDKTSFDLAIVGEGEVILNRILRWYLTPCRGVLPEKRVVYGEANENLDNIPFPARHLIDWTRYKRGIYWGKELLAPAVSIISSRGCPYNCIFCASRVVFGRRTRFRSVGNVVAETKHVMNTLGYRGFNFHDDTFCLNPKRVFDLCRAFQPLDIVWRCLSRVDTVNKAILMEMQQAGCKEIIYGIESGSQKILNILQKGTTVKQNLKAMKLTKKAGIQLKISLIVGNPRETWETIEETKKLVKACPPDFWNVFVFTPLPGSPVWIHPEAYGLKILTRDLSQYVMRGEHFNVVVETEEMRKEDIKRAHDELVELLSEISPP